MYFRHQTFLKLADCWLDDKAKFVKASTFATYRILIETHLKPFFGRRIITQISSADLQQFIDTKGAGDSLSPKSLRDIVIVFKMIMKYAYQNAYIKSADFLVKIPPQRRSKKIDTLTYREQRQLLVLLKQERGARNLGIFLSLFAGLRIGEVCALQWRDIDLENDFINVDKTLQRIYRAKNDTALQIGTPKTASSRRSIPLSGDLLKRLKEQRKEADYFVITGSSRPIEPRTYRNYFADLLRRAGVEPHRFHCLRHTFATRCIEFSSDCKTVSELLGHSTVNVTLDIYVHPNERQKRECIERVQQAVL